MISYVPPKNSGKSATAREDLRERCDDPVIFRDGCPKIESESGVGMGQGWQQGDEGKRIEEVGPDPAV